MSKAAKHIARGSDVRTSATADITRFLMQWLAEINVLRCGPADVGRLLDAAIDLLPTQPAIVGAAGHGLREALLAAGIGLERGSQWAPVQLELAPQALDLMPLNTGCNSRTLSDRSDNDRT